MYFSALILFPIDLFPFVFCSLISPQAVTHITFFDDINHCKTHIMILTLIMVGTQ